jgi:oligopeptidase B
MKKIINSSLLAVIVISMCSCLAQTGKRESQFNDPPRPEKRPFELTEHGDTRIDNYYWLNQRENPEVIEYLEAENAYLKEVMADTEEFQEKLFDEIVGRIKQDDESVPYLDNGYYYYTRFEEGFEYPVMCRKKGSLEAEEEVMLNVNQMAEGHSYFQVSGASVSPDNRLLAYGVDTVSRRKYTIYVKDLETGKIYEDKILETTGSVAWANDNSTFFFTRKNATTLRSEKIYRYELGSRSGDGKLVFFEEDETFSTGVGRSKSGSYLIISSGSTLSTEYRILDANRPKDDFVVFQEREKDLEYSIDHFGDHFYVLTNWNASNFKLMKTPIGATSKDNWIDVIPHRDDVLLSGFTLFNKFLVVSEVSNALPALRIIPHDGKSEHYISFEEQAFTARVSTNREFDTNILRFSYSSMTTPNSVFDYNMETKERELLKMDKVLGDFDPANYFSERKFVTAADGTKVPISIVYKKGTELDGRNPTLLYGYGSYGYSMSPSFSSVRLSLLDRGFIYVIAHIRGGQEMGRHWYEDGKLLKKKNTFIDFNDCAEYLIKEGYTQPEYLFAQGGSAGGLLMGAIINMRPDLYKGIIANVPWVDVVTTMLDASIPLTTSEYDEWGNPANKEYYDYMLSYSPYDNVSRQDYPAMLVTTGLHDSQVQYFEPAKWVAKLRDMKTDYNILLMNVNMEAGHGGASGRFKRYKETALEYAFIFNQLGIIE